MQNEVHKESSQTTRERMQGSSCSIEEDENEIEKRQSRVEKEEKGKPLSQTRFIRRDV